jgi:hypothetical protein
MGLYCVVKERDLSSINYKIMQCRLMHAVAEIIGTGVQKAGIELTGRNETFCEPCVTTLMIDRIPSEGSTA